MEKETDRKCTDQELYILIQQNSKAGFDQLYDQYGFMMYGLASQALQSKEYANEIVELTFVNVWNSIHQFNNQQKTFCIWMISMLMTTAKDYLESKNIKYSIKTENFPRFTFDIIEEEAC